MFIQKQFIQITKNCLKNKYFMQTSCDLKKRSFSKKNSNIEIVLAKKEHISNMKPTMKDFYLDEPLFKLQKIDVEKLGESFYEFKKKKIIVAIDKSNGVVAALAINSIIKPNNAMLQKEHAELHKENTDLFKALQFLSLIKSEPCLFKMLNVDVMWEIHILATAQKYRNLGLSTAVAKRSFKEALLNYDISIISMNCTNYLSAKIAQNLGMECVVKKHFNEYKDDNGYPLITNIPEQPNDTVNIFVYKKKNYKN